MRAACEILDCNDWKIEKVVALTGDRIQSIQRKKFGKIYRLTVYIILNFLLKINSSEFICLYSLCILIGTNKFTGEDFNGKAILWNRKYAILESNTNGIEDIKGKTTQKS